MPLYADEVNAIWKSCDASLRNRHNVELLVPASVLVTYDDIAPVNAPAIRSGFCAVDVIVVAPSSAMVGRSVALPMVTPVIAVLVLRVIASALDVALFASFTMRRLNVPAVASE